METFTLEYRGELQEFKSPYTDHQCREVLSRLTSNNFALSLSNQRSWSSKQRVWAHKIATEASQPSGDTIISNLDCSSLIKQFDHAALHLKWPTVRLEFPKFGKIRLKRAGDGSREPGSIAIVHEGNFIGRIHRNGTVSPRDLPDWVKTLLIMYQDDPRDFAAAYGQRYGHCCFCGKELTHGDSLEVGYGSICADRFGLPHNNYHKLA